MHKSKTLHHFDVMGILVKVVLYLVKWLTVNFHSTNASTKTLRSHSQLNKHTSKHNIFHCSRTNMTTHYSIFILFSQLSFGLTFFYHESPSFTLFTTRNNFSLSFFSSQDHHLLPHDFKIKPSLVTQWILPRLWAP